MWISWSCTTICVFQWHSTTCPLQAFQAWSKTTILGETFPLNPWNFGSGSLSCSSFFCKKKNKLVLYPSWKQYWPFFGFSSKTLFLHEVMTEEELLIVLKGMQHTFCRWAWLCYSVLDKQYHIPAGWLKGQSLQFFNSFCWQSQWSSPLLDWLWCSPAPIHRIHKNKSFLYLAAQNGNVNF